MKKVEIFLKIVGVLIAVAGFYVSQVGHFPWGQKGISKKFVQGMKGLQKLKTTNRLTFDDEGFAELSEIVMSQLKVENPSRDFGIIRIDKFKILGEVSTRYKGKSAAMLIPVGFDMSDGDGGPETIGSLQLGLEQIRSRDVFRWMAILLFIGIALVEIPSIIIQVFDCRKKNKEKPKLPSHVPPM